MSKVLSVLRSPAFRAGFMAAAVIAAVYAVIANWDEVRPALATLAWWQILLATAASFAFVWLTMVAWRTVLRSTNPIPSGVAARLFYVSQVAKYLPGGVWNFVAVAEMGVDYDISRKRSVSVLLLSMLISVVTGLGLSTIAIFGPADLASSYWWVLLFLPIFAAILHPVILAKVLNTALKVMGKDQRVDKLDGRAILTAVAVSLVAWIVAGVQVWILLTALGSPATLQTYFLTLSGYCLAWVVGFLVFFIPAGVGVREVVLGAALAGHASAGDIVVVVLLSRILFTVADLVLGLWAAIDMRKDRQ